MSLPDKFTIPEKRIPKGFSQGLTKDCVAITLTKILEVFNFIKTGEYVPLSKGYMYGRNNRPDKTQGGSDYDYMLNTLLTRGTVPESLCPERDEIPDIRKKLESRADIAELDRLAEEYKIISWEKIPGNIYKFENIKKCLYEHQMPIAGNMTGNTQHCTVIVGWDGDKILYQDHDAAGKVRKVSQKKFNTAYYLNGGIDMVKDFKSFDIEGFKKYISSLQVVRSVKKVQLHHTYEPSYDNFSGSNHESLQKGMQNYHVSENGWADIGQHFTVFPDGRILTGRSIESIPAGIKGANTEAVCIECLGNFDKGGDIMTEAQKNAIVAAVKILLDRFGLNADAVIYHAWWTSGGTALGDYVATKSAKTCPGTNFFGGNTKAAYQNNLLPLIENWGKKEEKAEVLKPVTKINDIIWELTNANILKEAEKWIEKCKNDKDVYWLCHNMANKLRGTL